MFADIQFEMIKGSEIMLERRINLDIMGKKIPI
jgi:hypothetical protein